VLSAAHPSSESSSRWPPIFLNPRSPRMPDRPSRAGWWPRASERRCCWRPRAQDLVVPHQERTEEAS
jgi:hypothetical protein